MSLEVILILFLSMEKYFLKVCFTIVLSEIGKLYPNRKMHGGIKSHIVAFDTD